MLEECFINEILQIGPAKGMANKMWNEVKNAYEHPSRHYHNLFHLEKMLEELIVIRGQFNNWPTIIFSIAYHDIVYNPLKKNNEEKSAALAGKRLTELNVQPSQIEKCKLQILATKSHLSSSDSDTNYFTDADLSILGSDPDSYSAYISQIRREYKFYPDLLYKPGRKKVVQHFLEMQHIFKTEYFRNKFEKQARINLERELGML